MIGPELDKLRAVLRFYQDGAADEARRFIVARDRGEPVSNLRVLNLDLAADEIRAAWAWAHAPSLLPRVTVDDVVARVGARGYSSPDLQAWWHVVREDVFLRVRGEAPVDCAPLP